jgi:hypothetical protein
MDAILKLTLIDGDSLYLNPGTIHSFCSDSFTEGGQEYPCTQLVAPPLTYHVKESPDAIVKMIGVLQNKEQARYLKFLKSLRPKTDGDNWKGEEE